MDQCLAALHQADTCLNDSEPMLWHCRGGTVRVTGVKYNTKQLVVQARLAWIGAMQVILSSYNSWQNSLLQAALHAVPRTQCVWTAIQ